ncbi:hypothetical protein N7468_006210 [Penicillium chermesinum]|uniref:Opsin n=1 Tax=Penicillium chermesinum TaxID=63820 RepID=A0A9W9NRV1_9EURO|nr:uncharacterized protein N7468_006210 [Penicillium chermesinum]KAJ5224985.1 hypothetical protein N7468_006210 [Penicillium chermesinum]
MMIPEPEMFPSLTAASPSETSVVPLPTVIPGLPITQELGVTGKRTLWVVTVLMGISSLVFYSLAARAPLVSSPATAQFKHRTNPRIPQTKRVFHTLSALITTISFITYLALATGQGTDFKYAHVLQKHKHVPNTHDDVFREVLYLRFVNWALTTPLLLINFALLSGLPGAHLLAAIAGTWVSLAAGYLGSFAEHTSVRWVWLTITCLGFLVSLHHGGFHAQRAARNKEAQTQRFFTALSGAGFVVSALYPIALAAGTLALKISVDVETILFAVQDIFVQGILGYWLLLTHDSATGVTLHLDGFWSHGAGNEGTIRLAEEEGA